ncbi:hypothetical protein DICVIV_02498 [Dictyocaulus viviparus]|uniref:Uncharacterized protein n=1 Tax=Dictyocaulus viviparus TaxID=29172 RepID=A0A0D8Y3L6_DICVI|nr:hypothetical protein DICVIV_02498 [Dictyocaulus viviparus]
MVPLKIYAKQTLQPIIIHQDFPTYHQLHQPPQYQLQQQPIDIDQNVTSWCFVESSKKFLPQERTIEHYLTKERVAAGSPDLNVSEKPQPSKSLTDSPSSQQQQGDSDETEVEMPSSEACVQSADIDRRCKTHDMSSSKYSGDTYELKPSEDFASYGNKQTNGTLATEQPSNLYDDSDDDSDSDKWLE